MRISSQKYDFDNRLLSVEELFRQRKYDVARKELEDLREEDFSDNPHELGLLIALQADSHFQQGNYRESRELGLRSSRIIAHLPLNRRYGRVLLILSKTYSALGDMRNAEIRAYDALASYRRAGEVLGQIDALNELARIAFVRCEFKAATGFLDDAIELAEEEPRKVAQLMGNVGTIRTLTGQLAKAEKDLNKALTYHEENGHEVAAARNLLSIAYLHLRKHEFVLSERRLDRALELIEKHQLKREKVIYLEYTGEIALEKGDSFKAKSLLSEAYHEGRLLAPDSALVSQSVRRLAEAELALENFDETMKYGQKALELARQIGEKAEVAMAHRVIALVFSARGQHEDALEHIGTAVDVAREVGDPVTTARTLLSLADVMMTAGSDETEKIRMTLDEAARLFRKLKLDYWLAETNFRVGMFACQQGNLSRGFKKLSRAEKVFGVLGNSAKVKQVSIFIKALADQAVALSVSHENQFKVFGNLVSQSDLDDVKTGQMDDVLDVLIRRTGADRAIIFTPDYEDVPVTASIALTPAQVSHFTDSFQQLVGEEISSSKPTLWLDCRRDPYINELLHDFPDVVASIIVIPFKGSGDSTSYVYIDKLTPDNTLNPFGQDHLNFAVGFADIIAFKAAEFQRAKLQEDNRRLKAQLCEEAAFPSIITRNAQMLEMLSQVRQVVESCISIAIEGETGCGKDLLARAVHYSSSRRDKRFISVNCAALPETLLESELFGYRRGAFTGADRDKPGLIEEADGGTFFLDEIADMPLSIQAKILRVLEEKEIVRLGDSVPRKVDVRIVSATNKNLEKQMDIGAFRSDLYYRLSVLTFRLLPLRERRDDIPLLAEHFLQGSDKRISAEGMKVLVAYDWRGNVRELENEIKKLILLAGDADEIGAALLSDKFQSAHGSSGVPSRMVPVTGDVTFGEEYSLYDYLAAHERRFIVMALRERNGVKKHAAETLNIPESTLRLKIKQYGIDLDHLDTIN